jgi:hypothetical protein
VSRPVGAKGAALDAAETSSFGVPGASGSVARFLGLFKSNGRGSSVVGGKDSITTIAANDETTSTNGGTGYSSPAALVATQTSL